ncbi:hypothetical protein H6G45_18170 [Synechocystis sp. FACHB-383]|uniref:hypothetical protein n=1 Tax=Synechocystis sp. FACHB-383 TaxID=2692864 RepID=UPI00168636E3|nr:hypothetical protein [Synechocystis sp. FACHB-383]MBD2655374.1 hypothetical protein [Synechocystis sp. FACHB-383]
MVGTKAVQRRRLALNPAIVAILLHIFNNALTLLWVDLSVAQKLNLGWRDWWNGYGDPNLPQGKILPQRIAGK